MRDFEFFSSGWYPVFFVELRGNDLLSVSKCFVRRIGRPALTESLSRGVGNEKKKTPTNLCVCAVCVF